MALTKAHNRMIADDAVNIKDYGAIGDGVTDDTAAIQAALTSLSSSGGSVFIPSGTYLVSSNLEVYSNTTIFGKGKSSIVKTTASHAFLVEGTLGSEKTNVAIQDLKLLKTPASGALAQFRFANYCFVSNVDFDGAGITCSGTKYTKISDCNFFNGQCINITSNDATSSGTWSESIEISGCYVAAYAGQGIDVYYAKNITFSDCISHGRTSTYGCGWVIEYQCQNIVLNNCISYDNTRAGFYIEGNIAYGVKQVALNNCIAYGNGESGVTCDANFQYINITGGQYHNNNAVFGSGNGLQFAGNIGVNITGAYIHNNAGNGIVWTSNPYYCNINGNTITDNGGYGILFSGTPLLVKVNDNLIANNTSGSTNGFTTGVSYDESSWTSYTPTIYKSDGTTAITATGLSVKYKILKNVVFIVGKFTCNSGDLDLSTYFTVPVSVAWTGSNTGVDARSGRGASRGGVSGTNVMDSIYYTSRLNAVSSATDTYLAFHATYEI